MAGAGYKLFNTGDVLTAAQVNTYLNEQTVMVFASSTARTTALSGVLAEGMMSYLQDTNAVEVYNGTSWVNVGNAGDLTEVQAGTGISVASGTGPIPVVTNTMATAIDAKGDLVVGTAADTFSRLAIGATNGHILQVDSAEATGMKWAAPAGGGMTLLSTTSLSGTSTTVSSISGSYTNLVCWIQGVDYNANAILRINPNGTAGNARISGVRDTTAIQPSNFESSASITGGYSGAMYVLNINNYTSTSFEKAVEFYGRIGSSSNINNLAGTIADTGAITSIQVTTAAGTASFTSGTIKIYGVN